MSTIIPKLRIQHFKSIKDLSLDCERINVFIGKPNAGKSNILEAISLLGQGYSGEKFMEGMVRYKSVFQLFNDFDTSKNITVTTNLVEVEVRKTWGEDFFFMVEPLAVISERDKRFERFKEDYDDPNEIEVEIESYKEDYVTRFSLEDFESSSAQADTDMVNQTRDIQLKPDGQISNIKQYGHNSSPVKRYEFRPQDGSDHSEVSFFLPPHGGNFYRIVRTNKELRQEIQNFLKPNGLELMLDDEKREVSVLQREEDALIRLPLHLLPDTFQRYIFHLAAIMSNRQSVLLFEEPEVHAYGPYIYQLAQYILDDEGGNQYFVTTHNPYFLIPLIQKGKDVAVFTTWFENFETRARRLSEAELSEMLDYGVDVFLNLEHFIPA